MELKNSKYWELTSTTKSLVIEKIIDLKIKIKGVKIKSNKNKIIKKINSTS